MSAKADTKACAYCNVIFTYPELQKAKIIFDENKVSYFHSVCFREMFRFLKYVFDKEMVARNISYSDQVFAEEDFFGARKLLQKTIEEVLRQNRYLTFAKKASHIYPFWQLAMSHFYYKPKIPKKVEEEIGKISPKN